MIIIRHERHFTDRGTGYYLIFTIEDQEKRSRECSCFVPDSAIQNFLLDSTDLKHKAELDRIKGTDDGGYFYEFDLLKDKIIEEILISLIWYPKL